MKGRVLIIAGSDPSGGAGLQADIKTVTMLGGYAMAAVTALTVQNTRGVKSVHPVDPNVIRDQIIACLEDIGADAVKIGMIGERPAAHAIAETLRQHAPDIPMVLDPVLAATSGGALAAPDMVPALRGLLMPLAAVVTPNADEAAALTGLAMRAPDDLIAAGTALLADGAPAALVKGGHLEGETVVDALVTRAGARLFENPRLPAGETHGTGCTLASAVATGLAQGMPLADAALRAIAFVRAAIEAAPGLGGGAGPLGHAGARGF